MENCICMFVGHEEEPIAGYCLNKECLEIQSYCSECIKTKHQTHKVDCLTVRQIKKMISDYINSIEDSEIYTKNEFEKIQKEIYRVMKFLQFQKESMNNLLQNLKQLKFDELFPIQKMLKVIYNTSFFKNVEKSNNLIDVVGNLINLSEQINSVQQFEQKEQQNKINNPELLNENQIQARLDQANENKIINLEQTNSFHSQQISVDPAQQQNNQCYPLLNLYQSLAQLFATHNIEKLNKQIFEVHECQLEEKLNHPPIMKNFLFFPSHQNIILMNEFTFFLCEPMIPKGNQAVLRFMVEENVIFIGVCLKDPNMKIISRDLKKIGHGFYLMERSGFFYSHHQEKMNSFKSNIQFQPEKIIDLEIDRQLNSISWQFKKKSNPKQSEGSFTMKIDFSENLFICVGVLMGKQIS